MIEAMLLAALGVVVLGATIGFVLLMVGAMIWFSEHNTPGWIVVLTVLIWIWLAGSILLYFMMG